ncbi:MAG: alpha/beta hydrolase [Polyangiaceae bacterium]|nr:alpha/beta hydrolase [Polyangiaceae bacterium]
MQAPTFLPFHAIVTAPDSSPTRYMFVLHGIFGSGGNFRTFIRRVAEACPNWGFVLVDLRGHGQSLGAPAPHSIESAAQDLVHLGEHLGIDVRGVMGHSFGGKVALAYAALRERELDEVWVLDSTPSTRADGMKTVGAAHVLDTLDKLPPAFPSRDFFVEHMTSSGMGRAQIDWLAMNVRRDGDVFRFRLDLQAIRALLEDYFARDLWFVVERSDGRRRLGFVIGGRSITVSPADRDRLSKLAETNPKLEVHVLERADHWVHVDDPDGLFEIVRQALS